VSELEQRARMIRINCDIFDFLQGQLDCREGVVHIDGKGESYDAGYSTEYNLQQIQSSYATGN